MTDNKVDSSIENSVSKEFWRRLVDTATVEKFPSLIEMAERIESTGRIVDWDRDALGWTYRGGSDTIDVNISADYVDYGSEISVTLTSYQASPDEFDLMLDEMKRIYRTIVEGKR